MTWCASLPVILVPQSDQPKPVTLIYPYYLNARFLERQLGWWGTYPDHVKAHLSAIIVDDASPWPAVEVLRDAVHPFPIRLFRIKTDVRWNWLAARNIGFRHAQPDTQVPTPVTWCLVTDMDHVLPASSAESLIYGQHDPETIYGLSRIEHTGQILEPHKNSWFITDDMFWKVGGYDEALSGFYGTDGEWRRRCAKTAPMAILESRLIRHEYDGDSSTISYKRKQPEDGQVSRLVAARSRDWKPKVLSFPYEEVPLKVAVA